MQCKISHRYLAQSFLVIEWGFLIASLYAPQAQVRDNKAAAGLFYQAINFNFSRTSGEITPRG
jgi:hypothetical protein